MYRLLFALVNLLNFVFLAQGRMITCVCTTTHCQEQQTKICNTTSMCFSQYLDRRDGSDPVVKGCITSKTPLLCENRRPAVHHASWPVLLCCNKNMCNQDVHPTPAGTHTDTKGKKADPTTTSSETYESPEKSPEVRTDNPVSDHPTDTRDTLSAIYIAVVVSGILCLLVIGVIGLLIFRRQTVLYNGEFGTVQSNGYLKGQSTEVTVAEIHKTTPVILGKTYDNKIALHT